MLVEPGPSRDERSQNGQLRTQVNGTMIEPPTSITTGWQPTCTCDIFGSYLPQPCTVMDPFSGSGTVGKVAIREGRKYIGVDISKDYLEGVTQQRYDGGLQIGMAI